MYVPGKPVGVTTTWIGGCSSDHDGHLMFCNELIQGITAAQVQPTSGTTLVLSKVLAACTEGHIMNSTPCQDDVMIEPRNAVTCTHKFSCELGVGRKAAVEEADAAAVYALAAKGA